MWMRDTVCENEGNDINAFGADSNTTGDGEWSEDADVSGDDQVTSLDALLILQAAASHIEL